MLYTCILEPFLAEDIEKENEGKQSWLRIHNYLENYGLGTNVTESFNDMLIQVDVTMDHYINGVHRSISCPKFFPKRNPCEIRINNYTHNCLHIWIANHDIQLSLSPHAMIVYILSYATKGQKGISIMLECACKDAKHGNMDLKESVHHMGNVFLNGVETLQEEAAFLPVQLPMIYMTRGNNMYKYIST